jgi:hypothetical protein
MDTMCVILCWERSLGSIAHSRLFFVLGELAKRNDRGVVTFSLGVWEGRVKDRKRSLRTCRDTGRLGGCSLGLSSGVTRASEVETGNGGIIRYFLNLF